MNIMNEFIDAQELARLHPNIIEIPSDKELKALKVGDIVKVCHNNECFWVIVKKIKYNTIYGQVDNELVRKHNFHMGDMIKFEKKNIYTIFPV